MLLWMAASSLPLAGQTLAARPVQAVRTGVLRDPSLRESSGLSRSRHLPGILFTVNDSGNDPEVFATDSSGRTLGRWRIPGTRNRDWEAIASGPCPAGWCLYLGDIGDNLERQPQVVIYRVREPQRIQASAAGAGAAPLDLDSAVVRYPDGAHDAEAIWVDDTGLYIVTKGRSREVRLFRVPGRAFGAGTALTAELLQVLPIEPDQRIGRWVTDASRSPDGRTIAVRTYSELYLFPALPGGRLGTPVSCNLAGLEPQGEGVTWLDDRRLALTSEAFGPSPGPVHIVTCVP